MSPCVHPLVYSAWDFVCFLDLNISFHVLGKFSAIISSNIFSNLFSLSSHSATTIVQVLVNLMLSQRFLSLLFFPFFPYILFCSSDFHNYVFQITFLFFSSVILILISFSILLISVCFLFISSRPYVKK